MAYGTSIKLSNISENWLFRLFNNNSHMKFDGTDDFIDCGTTDSAISGITSNITIAFWIRFPTGTLGSNSYIFVSNSIDDYFTGFNIYKDSADKISILVSDSGNNTHYKRIRGDAVSADTWYFVAITSDMDGSFDTLATTTILYNNNATTESEVGSVWNDTKSVGYSGSGKTLFGKSLKQDPDVFAGFEIINFAILNVQLDSDNLTAIYNGGNFLSLKDDSGEYTQSSNLRAYWEFNNDKGYTIGSHSIKDLVNDISGTITGATHRDFLPLSFKDATDNNVFYHGSILNKPSIRESIDLKKSVSKTSNMSLDVIDFNYKGSAVSTELFGGTNKYINQSVTVYSQINGDSPQQIGLFRLINVSTNGKTVKLSLATQRPWDYITFPQDQATISLKYFPVAYGHFDENTSTQDNQNLSESRALYPAPVDNTSGKITALVTKNHTSVARLHHYEKDCDQFVPICITSNAFTDASEAYQGGYATKCRTDLFRGFKTKHKTTLSNEQWVNTDNAFDSRSDDSSTYAEFTKRMTESDAGAGDITKDLEFTPPNIIGKITAIEVFTRYRLFKGDPPATDIDGSLKLYVGSTHIDTVTSSFSDSILTDTATLSGAELTSHYTNNNNQLPNFKYRLTYQADSAGDTISCRIYDSHIIVKVALDTSADSVESTKQYLDDLEYMYVGDHGLTESYSGSNNNITEIHEAHRDLLTRFAGLPTADPTNWSDLNSAKDWQIRYWQLEPVSLEKELEKLQYEGGFIFRYRFDGTGQYIFIKDSYGSVDATLSKYDINNISVAVTPFSELITKMDISYRKHPSTNKYLTTVSSSNSTSRGNWNIQTKENIQKVNLDAYVGHSASASDIPTSPASNPNDDFYTYYDDIFGDIKLLVSCDIVNPAKWVDSSLNPIEVGSTIAFDNDNMFPESPMGYNSASWSSQKFIITDINRGVGKLSIKARQI